MHDPLVYRSEEILLSLGAENIAHSNGTLFDHLLGTQRILSCWGAPDYVARGGLVHSVYSTQYFREGPTDLRCRADIEALVGSASERLAFLFSILDRQYLWSAVATTNLPSTVSIPCHSDRREVQLDRATLQDLALLECANYVEQCSEADGSPGLWVSWVLRTLTALDYPDLCPALLSLRRIKDEDENRARQLYLTALVLGTAEAWERLQNVIELNPNVGEPYIFLSLIELGQGNWAAARSYADSADNKFRTLGSSWDQRMSFSRWVALPPQLAQAANARRGEVALGLKEIAAFAGP
ncbi:DUF6817 domain-containing protein [Shinella sp.]|uniref:DUF6817 domain-containing protein n=1 Tax=Shinella sp. TaxID=1870904 RepID=UPI0039B948BB